MKKYQRTQGFLAALVLSQCISAFAGNPPDQKLNLYEFSSPLPLLRIQTHGQKVTKENKISAELFEASSPLKEKHYSQDLFYSETARITPIEVKLKGHSSLKFPQKQYSIEFKKSAAVASEGLSVEVKKPEKTFLGLPHNKEWSFHAPYVDKTLMRNALTFQIARKLL